MAGYVQYQVVLAEDTKKPSRDSQSVQGKGEQGLSSGMVVLQEHYGLDRMSEGVSYFNWNGEGQARNNP